MIRVAAAAVLFAVTASACAALPSRGNDDELGLIVHHGVDGLVLTTPSGQTIADIGGQARQPTWSRDGDRFVSLVPSLTGLSSVEVRDGGSGELVSSHTAPRPYFFFSWSDDGRRIAALGPGRVGTTLDILDADGVVLRRDLIEGGSVFVAWEPGGGDLLVHRDTFLQLVPADEEPVELAEVGRDVRAPAWVPGTRDTLVVVDDGDGRRLRRVSIDETIEQGTLPPGEDLGTVAGPSNAPAAVIVDGTGTRAAIVHAPPGETITGEGGVITASAPAGSRPIEDTSQSVEVIVLESGRRTTVAEEPTLWVEWSPDSEKLLIATLAPGADWARWSTWAGDERTDLALFIPSTVFLTAYMAFADQYVEQPRLWAPDSQAFTFGGRAEGGDPGTVVVDLSGPDGADRVELIGTGIVAFWSPTGRET